MRLDEAPPGLQPGDVFTAGRADSVAVVICAYTPLRLPVLRRVLRTALDQHDPGRDEIVVVIDHHPALQESVSREFPQIRVVANAGPRGLSGARNTGVRASAAPIVVFLDDDAVPAAGWLAAWRTCFVDPGVVLAGGAVRADWESGAPPAWFPAELGWVVGCDYLGMPESGSTVRNPIGANMAIRRSALDVVGFSADLGRIGDHPVGCEETELGIRIGRLFGATAVRRDTTPVVDHQVPQQRASIRYVFRRCFYEGRSKRVLSGSVGTTDSLASERAFVIRALRSGLFRHLGAVRSADVMGVLRAVVLGAGTVVTAVGFATGRSGSATASEPGRPESAAGPSMSAPTSTVVRAVGRPGQRAADSIGVTAVVCSLGREPRLVGTVQALLGQNHRLLTVVVVDNDPAGGGVRRLLAGIADERLTIVDEPRRGLSVARNTGLATATGEVVAFTDDDAIPDPDWIAALANVFAAAGADVSCVTGRVLPATLDTRWERLFEQYGAFDKGALPLVWAEAGPESLRALGVAGPRGALYPYGGGEFGSGNNMAFWRRRLLDLGGFDPALGAGTPACGGEDLDIFRAVVLAGEAIVYTPSAIVRHHHRATEAALRRQLFGYGVGMSAVIGKIAISDPRVALTLLGRLPAAVRVLLGASSTKNAGKAADYPASLTAIEIAGYLAGPLLLLRSRRRSNRAAVRGRVPAALASRQH